MTRIDVLATLLPQDTDRYKALLSSHDNIRLHVATSREEAFRTLADKDTHIDVLVLDNRLGQVFEFVKDLRQTYPRLFIILVDEDADFGLPGQADDMSTTPFKNNDLIKRILRLMSDRQLETLRADSLPAVRQFAKRLRRAPGETGKQKAAVSVCMDMGYVYVALYCVVADETQLLELKAQDGPTALQQAAPRTTQPHDIMTWVARNGQSRAASAGDSPTHPFINSKQVGNVTCVPVTISNKRYGVIVACMEHPGPVQQENVQMLELISAQLAAVLAREIMP